MKKFVLPIFLCATAWANIAITTTTLPNGTVGTAYSATVATTSGCAPATWTVIAGALPAGITMTPVNKPISLKLAGTPTTAGTFSFTLQVKGCHTATSKKAFTITIQGTAQHVVNLNWNASTSSNIAGYNMYRSPDGTTWVKINVSLIASTLFSDSTVSNNTSYWYGVTAVDISGNESVKSNLIQVSVPN